MGHLAAAALASVLAAVAGGCVAVPPSPAPAASAGKPMAAPAVEKERVVRYYRDESGALWDDRGRRVEAPP